MKAIALLFAAALACAAAALADPVVIRSPDQGRTWSMGDEVARQLVWDAKARKFSVFLTYTNIDDTARVSAPEQETLGFSFPDVAWDEAEGLFVLALPGGGTVPVARRVRRMFLPQIVLLPNCRVDVSAPDGVLSVTLVVSPPR